MGRGCETLRSYSPVVNLDIRGLSSLVAGSMDQKPLFWVLVAKWS
jgi:hypothetical protein